MHSADMTFDMTKNEVTYHNSHAEPWKVTVVDTGLNTMTGGRIKKIRPYIGNESFMLTYGDGVSDINIGDLIKSHESSGKMVTLTAVQPSGKFGALQIDSNDTITAFKEKPQGDGAWINGGYFVCSPEVFDYIPDGDGIIWERTPLESITKKGGLHAYHHTGFWKPMDTLRDKLELNEMWAEGSAPWKVWK